ncbi:MAG: beta-N-acetylhexosaminidase, partial [Asticcacaulis sp.]
MSQSLFLTASPVLRARRAALQATVATVVLVLTPMGAPTAALAQESPQPAEARESKDDRGWLKRLSSFLMPARDATDTPAPAQTLAVAAAPSPLRADELIVPVPARQTVLEGQITLNDGMRLAVAHSDTEALAQARYFADLMKRTRNLSVTVVDAHEAATIRLVRNGTPDPKLKGSYGLQVTPAGIQISATDGAGLFYGLGSLWQLATADGRTEGAATIRAVDIQDQPRFGWRGLMVDSARHMQSIETLKQVIDVMALHKLNVFHWHLVDDQGWRLEIKKYPRLTEVGAWRVPQGQGRDVIDPATGKPKLYGGYYSQEQVKDLVAYAAARHITIVPEIEMPGHAHASVVAYPHLGSAKPAPETSSDWGVFPYIYNIDDSTFKFLEDVLDETMTLFPSEFIHVGGDEAVKIQWKQSKRIQRQMKKLGIKDEHALQSYFIQRIEKHLNAKGRKLIGWDEILEGGLAPNATVMSWRGIDGAVAAAKMGHDTVLAAQPMLYLDRRQGLSEREPPGRKELVTLQRVYDFDVTPDSLTENELGHILGVQANIWTEHMRLEDNFRKMAFPRTSAL